MKILLFLIHLLLFSNVAVSQDHPDSADELRESLMKVLTGLDSTRFDDYRALFITKEEMLMLINNVDADEVEKEEYRIEIKSEWIESARRKEFYDLLAVGSELELNWHDISYEDFDYERMMRDSIEILEGTLYFSQGEQLYGIDIGAVQMEGVFRIVVLEYLEYADESYDEDWEEALRELEKAAMEEQGKEYLEEDLNEDTRGELVIEEAPLPVEAEVYSVSEEEAQFPGGAAAMQRFISENIHYPEAAKKDKASGKVYVQFVVEKDGTLSNIKIMRSPHDAMSEEVIRLVESMPKWEPGKQNGEAVRVRYTLPVMFVWD